VDTLAGWPVGWPSWRHAPGTRCLRRNRAPQAGARRGAQGAR